MAGKQAGGRLTQYRLMSDNNDSPLRHLVVFKPTCCEEKACHIAVNAKAFVHFEWVTEHLRSLLTTQGWAGKDMQISGNAFSYPFGDLARLSFAMRCQFPVFIRPTVFRFCMAP